MTGRESEKSPGYRELWRGYYGKEPFDLRLTLLRLFYKLPVIALVTLLGVLIFGGGYYVKNVLLQKERFFAATSVYRVEYVADSVDDLMRIYINEMSWNTYIQSELFLELVQARLARQNPWDDAEVSREELAEGLEAFVWSDIRVPAITVTMDDPDKCEQVARAVEAVMTQDFALPEIGSISVVDSGKAEEVFPDVRVGRAVLLSAVLSCFFAVIVFLLKETGDDSIWLPCSIWRRYGLKAAGTLESRELAQNLEYFFRQREDGMVLGRRRFAACMVQEGMEPEHILDLLRQRCPEVIDSSWFAVGSPLEAAEVYQELREAEGILLVVRAGSHAGRKLEYVLENLEQQDCRMTAAILWEADERLLQHYYFGKSLKKG